MTEQVEVSNKIEAPTAKEVVEKTKDLEPFIPEPLMDLHKSEAGPNKYIARYQKGSTGPLIPGSFSVNSGDNMNGVSVSLREYSHTTGWDYSRRQNTYESSLRAQISTTFNNLDGHAEQAAVEILSLPEPPEGYVIREGETGRTVKTTYADAHTVKDALRANFTSDRVNPRENRFAIKYINKLSDRTVAIHVDIGGGAYSESVYYDKV